MAERVGGCFVEIGYTQTAVERVQDAQRLIEEKAGDYPFIYLDDVREAIQDALAAMRPDEPTEQHAPHGQA